MGVQGLLERIMGSLRGSIRDPKGLYKRSIGFRVYLRDHGT